MKRRALLSIAVLIAGSLSVPALLAAPGDNPPPAGQPAPPQRDPGGGGGGDPGPRRGPMNPFANMFEQMDRVLNLTEDQKPKVKEQVDELNKDIEDLRTSSMEKIRAAMAAAQGGNDPEKARQDWQDTIKQVNEDYQKIMAAHQTKISALLTDDQRVTWESFKLMRALQQRFGPVDLTDVQRQQIRQLVEDAGKDLAAAKDEAATAAITGKVVKKVVADILTEEQAAKLVATNPPPLGIGPGGMGPGGPGGPRDGNGPPRRPNQQ
jgi:Spy/CpxP family protein refolding chaperone